MNRKYFCSLSTVLTILLLALRCRRAGAEVSGDSFRDFYPGPHD